MTSLFNLDVRDLRFWKKRARIVELKRRVDLCQAVRIGMATGQGYMDEMTKLHYQILNLETGGE